MLQTNALFIAYTLIILISYCFSQTNNELSLEDLCSAKSDELIAKKAFLLKDRIGLLVDYNNNTYMIAITGLSYALELTITSVQLWNDWYIDPTGTDYTILETFIWVFPFHDNEPLPLIFVTPKYRIKVEFNGTQLVSLRDLRLEYEDEKSIDKLYQIKLKNHFGSFFPSPVFMLFPNNDRHLPPRAFVYFNDIVVGNRKLYVMRYDSGMQEWLYDDDSGYSGITLNNDGGVVVAAFPISGYLFDEDNPIEKHFQIIEILSDGQFRVRIIYLEGDVYMETRILPSKMSYNDSKVVYNGHINQFINCPTISSSLSTVTITESSSSLNVPAKQNKDSDEKKPNKRKVAIIIIIVLVLVILAIILTAFCFIRRRKETKKNKKSKSKPKPKASKHQPNAKRKPKLSKPQPNTKRKPKLSKPQPNTKDFDTESTRTELKSDTDSDQSDTSSIKSLDKTAANRISDLNVFFDPNAQNIKKESNPKTYDENMSYSIDGVKRK